MPKCTDVPAEFDAAESPVAWFFELQLAVERGNFRRAALAQEELFRLGWTVKPRAESSRPEGREGGR